MIEIKKRNINTPYYILRYEYMIGDSNGYVNKELRISFNNPYLEKYCRLLKRLKRPKNYNKLCLRKDVINKCLLENQINEEEYDFLMRIMFGDKNSKFLVPIEHLTFSNEFYKEVISYINDSYLFFLTINLVYVNENGVHLNTEFDSNVFFNLNSDGSSRFNVEI